MAAAAAAAAAARVTVDRGNRAGETTVGIVATVIAVAVVGIEIVGTGEVAVAVVGIEIGAEARTEMTIVRRWLRSP